MTHILGYMNEKGGNYFTRQLIHKISSVGWQTVGQKNAAKIPRLQLYHMLSNKQAAFQLMSTFNQKDFTKHKKMS